MKLLYESYTLLSLSVFVLFLDSVFNSLNDDVI